MLKRLRKTHTNQLGIGFMNTCTHKPTQEIHIHIMGGKSFHSIIYIMLAAIPINSVGMDEEGQKGKVAWCCERDTESTSKQFCIGSSL